MKTKLILCGSIAALTTIAADRLPETVVTARRDSLTTPITEVLRAEVQQTPGGVTVIDSDTYKRGRATTLKDALDYAPGVFVQPRFGAEEARISIRGSGIQRTFHGRGLKLMQDGVPVNLADGGFDFQAIDPLTAKSVEVYPGANALETRVYVSTATGSVTRHTDRERQFEANIFSNFHKLAFIRDKNARDLVLSVLTGGAALAAIAGIILFFATRSRSS